MTTKDTPGEITYEMPADWRGAVLSRIRALIKQADPEAIEDVKWKTASNPAGVLVWYHDGMICTGEIYKQHLRLSLAKGQFLKDQDPTGLIDTFRAIIIREDDKIDEVAFKNLIRAAVTLNSQGKRKSSKSPN